MKVAVFGTKHYDRLFLTEANVDFGHELQFYEPRLNIETLPLVRDVDAVCVFVNDELTTDVVHGLAAAGVRAIALRCAGFNNVDLPAAQECGIRVVRVPAYSPHAVAEHTVGLLLALNRNIHRAYGRVREGNFALDGLLGFDLYHKTVGLIGTGRIGAVTAGILNGFGCRLLAHDLQPAADCLAIGVEYVALETLLTQSDVISLHCPLTPQTHHLINAESIAKLKRGAMLINTSRGAIVDTQAVIAGLKSGQIGSLGIDVYEEEADLFFEDLSNQVMHDDTFARLLTFPNVLITGHQAFFTREALSEIARTTLGNLADLEAGRRCSHLVAAESISTAERRTSGTDLRRN